jgi:hypothetical protein
MAFEINKEAKTVETKKDCQTCISLKACKFHAKMRELCQSNEFYEMTEYLEWNNSLRAFDLHASCQFYRYKYPKPVNGEPVTIESDPEIIDAVLSAIPRPEHCNSYFKDLKKDLVTYNTYNVQTKESNKVEIPLSQVLSNFTYLTK